MHFYNSFDLNNGKILWPIKISQFERFLPFWDSLIYIVLRYVLPFHLNRTALYYCLKIQTSRCNLNHFIDQPKAKTSDVFRHLGKKHTSLNALHNFSFFTFAASGQQGCQMKLNSHGKSNFKVSCAGFQSELRNL